ncbi:MAG: MATE family efflux transporter [Hyphomicrobiales bacterium]|nr:MAG: MATE family efflux transporter [Hyphomicrobiales bacterium]
MAEAVAGSPARAGGADRISAEEPRRLPPNPLVTAPILPTLLRLTVPNLIAMSVTALVAICETAYVGILGTVELAAIALVFPMVMLMQMLSSGAMGGGVSSAVSRALGAGDVPRAAALALHALSIGAIAGIFFTVAFTAFGDSIFSALGGRGPVLAKALSYAHVALTAAVLIWLVNTLASIVRGTGNMNVPSFTLLAASLLQIVVGGTFGLGLGPIPRFGLPGVAMGLVVGFGCAAVYLLWFLMSGRARITLRFAGVPLNREMFFDILKVGGVAALSPLQSVLTVLIVTKLVSSYGVEALAGYGIGARLEFLLVPIAFAVGVATVPMVGMAIGARDVTRARAVAWTGAIVTAVALGFIGVVVGLFPGLWAAIFTADAGVRGVADTYLRLAGPTFGLFGLGLCLYFASQGAGKVLQPVLAGTLRLAIVIAGGWYLTSTAAPLWALFAMVALSLALYGIATGLGVYATSWAPAAGNKA